MHLEKRVIRPGDLKLRPKAGDEVGVLYTGWILDPRMVDMHGQCVDTTEQRGIFKTRIGVGQVVQGWDILILQMSLGEKSVLLIPSTLAYGKRGFPGLIEADADLIFEVELRSINDNIV